MPPSRGITELERRNLLKWLAVGGSSAVAGCAGGDETPTATESMAGTPTDTEPPATETERSLSVGGTFIAASTSTSGAPHPLRVDDTTTFARIEKLYDGPGGALGPETFMPQWFEEMTISDSYDVVEYTIRDGLQWGAGYGQLDAEDYMYLLQEIVLQSGDADWYGFTDTQFYRVGPEQELISYEKTGPLSIRAELPVSKPQWLHEDPLISQVALPKGLLKKYVPNQDKEGLDKDADIIEGKLSQGESNLGPYEFVTWERGSRWEYKRNPDYYLQDHADDEPYASHSYTHYDKSPYFETYRYQQFDESSTALSALKAGEVQSAGINSRKVAQYRGREDITIWESKFDNGVFWLNLNHRINGWAPIRESRKVRYALANLYDKETIIQEINNGNAVPLATFHPSWGPFYPPEDELFEPEGSVERAKTLLEEGTSSDYGYDGSGNFVGPDGEQVELTAVRTTGNPAVELGANYLQQRLEEAGIKLSVTSQQWQSLLLNYAMNSVNNVDGVAQEDLPDWAPVGRFNGGPWDMATSKNDWDLMLGLGFATSPYAPWSAIKSTMPQKGTFNFWGYAPDDFDVLGVINQASTASDPSVTQTKMTDLFGFLSRDMPLVWIQSGYITQGFRKKVTGFPGEETDDGYRATSFFTSPDSARLMGFKQA